MTDQSEIQPCSSCGYAINPGKVVPASHHDVVRPGLKILLKNAPGLVVVGSGTSLVQGVELIVSKQPDIVITDLSLGDSKGLNTVMTTVSAHAGKPVLVVSMHDEMVCAEQVLTLGAKGYVMKDQAYSQAEPAARAIASGGIWMSFRVSSKLLGRARSRTGTTLLRESA